jgi:hypothetical protein
MRTDVVWHNNGCARVCLRIHSNGDTIGGHYACSYGGIIDGWARLSLWPVTEDYAGDLPVMRLAHVQGVAMGWAIARRGYGEQVPRRVAMMKAAA